VPVRSAGQRSCSRPERSTRSRKTILPRSRRPMTRPATRRFVAASWPGSSDSASARTAAISSRSGKRLGSPATRASLVRRAALGFSLAGAPPLLLPLFDLELEQLAREVVVPLLERFVPRMAECPELPPAPTPLRRYALRSRAHRHRRDHGFAHGVGIGCEL